MGLLDLPAEILLLITEFLCQKDLNALQQTNRRSHSLLYSTLLRRNIRIHKSSALLWAAEFNNLELAKRLFREGATLSSIKQSKPRRRKLNDPLFFAAENGNEEMVKLLLEHGADPIAEGRDGVQVHQVAAKAGHIGVCEILLLAILARQQSRC